MINILETLHSSFYFKNKKKHFICYDPQIAFIYYKNYRINLLTEVKEEYSIENFLKELKNKKLHKRKKFPQVYHFFYELGHLLASGLDIDEETPLAAHIIYRKYRYSNYQMSLKENLINKSKFKGLDENNFKKSFEKIQNHLKDGDCYQVNFTYKDLLVFDSDLSHQEVIHKFYNNNKKLGAYAHHTYFPHLEKLVLSNSPECLFQVYEKKNKLLIHTLPIKGTMSSKLKSNKEELLASKKNEGELFMIVDLLRNDLARIEKPNAKVLFKKKILEVPGLFHLYSRIQTEVSKNVNLYDLLKALFPGGSVTGAPKKRVMNIIKELESENRGYYCGSTYLDFKNIKTASINIRTAEIDLDSNSLSYGTGGGITLKSNQDDEYEEMILKRESFLKLLNSNK